MRVRTALHSLCVVAAIVCSVGAQAPSGLVAALLAEGKVVLVDAATGAITGEYAAASPPPNGTTVGTLGLSGQDLFVVLPGADAPVLAAVDVRTRQGRRIVVLPADRYPGLAIGPRTRRIFAFGSGGAVIAVDPAQGTIAERISLPAGGDVYGGGVSADERRLYLTYHGQGSGVAWFDRSGDSWAFAGHLPTHGNFALDGDRILAATGGAEILEYNPAGAPRRLNTQLVQNHLMEFAVDRERRVIYTVGSCGYAGGMTATPWPVKGEQPGRVLVPERNYSTCGERIAVSSDGKWVAIASRVVSLPSVVTLGRPGLLLVVDTGSGAILQEVRMTSDVVDVLAVK